MTKRKMIQIASPSMDEKEWHALKEPLENGWLTQGPKVASFEKAFAKRHAVKYAKAVSNCTNALHLALIAVGVKPGDAVIVPSFTWVATANAVEYCGATPLFCDIDPITFNINPASVYEQIKKGSSQGHNIKAIISVHLFGLCADMDKIMNLAREFNLAVIEDAACAAGAAYKDQAAGSIGDVGCFSFHPRKILVTGEGGMCTTNNKTLAEQISRLRNHGASMSEEQRHQNNAPYMMPDFSILGYNYRMTDLQGAIGFIQLEKLDRFIAERVKWATYYNRELADLQWITIPPSLKNYKTNWQAYVCRVNKNSPFTRDQLLKKLFEKGISTRIGTHAVHMLDFYCEKYQLKENDFPNSKEAYHTSLALPLHNGMNSIDYEYVVNILHSLAL